MTIRIACAALCFACVAAVAQDEHEQLGVSDTAHDSGKAPLVDLMASLPSTLKPELMNVHPRVYFTDAELATLRQRAHGPEAAEWKRIIAHIRAIEVPPPPPPAEARRAQNEVAMGIAQAAFAYRIDGNPLYLKAAIRYMDAAVSYDVWGYSFSKPNTDLAAGHLLYGLGLGYDLLYHDLTPAQRDKYRAKLARQGHLMYEAFKPRPGRVYAYSQNHTFIPMAGLGIAAYAVYGEVPEAAEWARLARAVYQRVLETYSHDGYYYEGYEYWIFATPWLIHYLDAQKHAVGEDLFDQPGLRNMYLYAAHAQLPGGNDDFDFGDVYDGPISRAGKGEDYERSHPGGHFLTNYNVLYDLARQFHDPKAQGVADWMRDTLHQVNAEEWWSLVWLDPSVKPASVNTLQPWHLFPDMDVVFWRSSWDANATAVAFKCGPPEGHETTQLIERYKDWRLEDGHVHPDVNSFILFAKGNYLTGDSGYAGVPRTTGHNTLLVNGQGQGKEGTHDAWHGTPYSRLNTVRIVSAEMDAKGFAFVGEGAGAYDASLGLTEFQRTVTLNSKGKLEVHDVIKDRDPATFTELLHSDTTIGQRGALQFVIPKENFALKATVNAEGAELATRIEPNIVMGPGRPGSVDKGTPEQRGERLDVATKKPTTTAEFHWQLVF
ncbi:MAG TPA: DUF4962 domain-containing protein [Bryocella sp.]|nr:DUF4962 domain-containing protein [Bryocella sp.]